MKIIKKAVNSVKSLFSKAYKAFDIRDFFVFGGLGMLGYGLYLKWGEWLALMVCGIILFILGLLWPVFLTYAAKGVR